MYQDNKEKEIIEKLKQEFQTLPGRVILAIAKEQFKYASKHIKEAEITTIFLHNLGNFKLRKSVLTRPDLLAKLLCKFEDVCTYKNNNKSYKDRKQKEFNEYKAKHIKPD